MKAVVVDRSAPGGLTIRDVSDPAALPSEALVRVAAISLNRGEVRRAKNAQNGWRPGWDIAGTIERAAADGSGPPAGSRVVGLATASGGWAERVAIPTRDLAVLPDTVSFERAATLPVAGLTALYALEKRGSLLGRRVLVTGASGGVGVFALQLARLSGAYAVGLVHQERKREIVARFADVIVEGETAEPATQYGPFDTILESVGGQVFSTALALLAQSGILVTYGTSAQSSSTIEVAPFYSRGASAIYGFFIFYELERGEPAGLGLARLLRLVD
ncbi:MAG TPA: zinc-binding dehydrogenase, partial [Candidatus Acidoferrum sp.]|nr:zinc-binding dehydrogenase [Candidatus Acidoferrum sp.]